MIELKLYAKEEVDSELGPEVMEKFWKHLRAYDEEIGGSDMGPGGYLAIASYIVAIFSTHLGVGKLVGFVLGMTPGFKKVFSKERSFSIIAIYLARGHRSSRMLLKTLDELVELLENEGFDAICLYQETPGLMTEKGYRILRIFHDRLVKETRRREKTGRKGLLAETKYGLNFIYDPQRYKIKAQQGHLDGIQERHFADRRRRISRKKIDIRLSDLMPRKLVIFYRGIQGRRWTRRQYRKKK